MASKATREAFAINALGKFLEGFQKARAAKKQTEREEEQFKQTLALEALKQKAAARDAEFKAFRALQDDRRAVTGMGATRDIIDPVTQKVVGTLGAKLSESAVKSERKDLEDAFRTQFPGSRFLRPAPVSQSPETGSLPGVKTPDITPPPIPVDSASDFGVSSAGIKGKTPGLQPGRKDLPSPFDAPLAKGFQEKGGTSGKNKELAARTQGAIISLEDYGESFRNWVIDRRGEDPDALRARLGGKFDKVLSNLGFREDPQLKALTANAVLQVRSLLRGMGEGARMSDQDVSAALPALPDAAMTPDEITAITRLALKNLFNMMRAQAGSEEFLNSPQMKQAIKKWRLDKPFIERKQTGGDSKETPEQRKARLLKELKGAR